MSNIWLQLSVESNKPYCTERWAAWQGRGHRGRAQASGCHMRRSTRTWLTLVIHTFLSSLVSALSQFLRGTQTVTCVDT